jgi:hypothetical protein
MKKILTISFVLIILMSTMLTAFAGSSFVSSPSKNLAPELIASENASDGCTAQIVITAYADRANLGEKEADVLTKAYAIIASAQDLGKVDADIADLAKELNIDSADFAVSELFDIRYINCDGHEVHGEFTITIKPTSTENFAAMLHYNGTEWEVIESEVKDGEITFVAELFSPFAIMVHSDLPAASSNATPWIIGGIALLLILIIIIILILVSRKKKKNEQEQ